MGLPCSTAACYRRMATTDEYHQDALWYSTRPSNMDTESFLATQLGKFHYEVHAFALMLEPYENCRTKAIYFYVDGIRVMCARAHYNAAEISFFVLQYRNAHWRNLYHDSMEVLPKNRFPLLKHYFTDYFKWFQSCEGSYYTNQWPYTLYKKARTLTHNEREQIISAVEISI